MSVVNREENENVRIKPESFDLLFSSEFTKPWRAAADTG